MRKEAINSKVVIIDKNGEPHYMGEVTSIDFHNDYLLELLIVIILMMKNLRKLTKILIIK